MTRTLRTDQLKKSLVFYLQSRKYWGVITSPESKQTIYLLLLSQLIPHQDFFFSLETFSLQHQPMFFSRPKWFRRLVKLFLEEYYQHVRMLIHSSEEYNITWSCCWTTGEEEERFINSSACCS